MQDGFEVGVKEDLSFLSSRVVGVYMPWSVARNFRNGKAFDFSRKLFGKCLAAIGFIVFNVPGYYLIFVLCS